MNEDVKQLLQAQAAEIKDLHRKMESIEKRHEEITRKLGVSAKTGPAVSTGLMAAGSILTGLLGGKTGDRKSGKVESVRMGPRAKPATPAPAPAPSFNAAHLRDSIITVLLEAGRPLSFQDVFTKLMNSGADLPADKPKLAMRKILYNKNMFDMLGGMFTLKPGILPMGNAAPDETPPEPATGADVENTARPDDEVLVLDAGAHQMNARVATVRKDAAAVPAQSSVAPDPEPPEEAIPPDELDEEVPPDELDAAPAVMDPAPVQDAQVSAPVPAPTPAPATAPATAPAPAQNQPAPAPIRLKPKDPFINRLEAILGPGAARVKKPE